MRPHEETWSLQNGALFGVERSPPNFVAREAVPFALVTGSPDQSGERARHRLARMNLAAYAPELARTVIDLSKRLRDHVAEGSSDDEAIDRATALLREAGAS